MAEWPNADVLKTFDGDEPSGGSNPSASDYMRVTEISYPHLFSDLSLFSSLYISKDWLSKCIKSQITYSRI